jgi:hypothetical protein
MWVFINDTFLSIVQSENSESLLVRARIKGDIEHLFPGSIVEESDDRDYRFRAVVPRDQVKEAMSLEIDRITYHNFKDSIPAHEYGRKRVYSNVWATMSTWQEQMYNQLPWHIRLLEPKDKEKYLAKRVEAYTNKDWDTLFADVQKEDKEEYQDWVESYNTKYVYDSNGNPLNEEAKNAAKNDN